MARTVLNAKWNYAISLMSIFAAMACTEGRRDHGRSVSLEEGAMEKNASIAEAEESAIGSSRAPAAAEASKSKGEATAAAHGGDEPVAVAKHGKKSKHRKPASDAASQEPVASREAQALAKVAPAQHSVGSGGYLVQLGTFKLKDNADRLVERAHKAGLTAELSPVNRNNNETWHVVRMGPVHSRPEAEELSQKAKKELSIEPLLVTEKQAH